MVLKGKQRLKKGELLKLYLTQSVTGNEGSSQNLTQQTEQILVSGRKPDSGTQKKHFFPFGLLISLSTTIYNCKCCEDTEW